MNADECRLFQWFEYVKYDIENENELCLLYIYTYICQIKHTEKAHMYGNVSFTIEK